MHMPRKQWYTYSTRRTGRMRTSIGSVKVGFRQVHRYVTVQFEVEIKRYWSAYPRQPGSVPEDMQTDITWVEATPDDFVRMVGFETKGVK